MLKRLFWGVLILTLSLLTFGPAATGQEKVNLITAEFKDENLKKVMEEISRMTKVTIVVSPEVDKKFTAFFHELTLEDAVRVIMEQTGVVIRKDGEMWRVSDPPQVKMTFQNADLRTVISLIADLSGASIIVAQEVQGNVDVHLNETPWDTALEQIVKTAGFAMVRETGGIIRIVPVSALTTQMDSRTFRLNYIRPRSAYRAKITTDFADRATGGPSSDPASFSLYRALDSIRSRDGRLTYDPDLNIMIATDTKTTLDRMSEIVKEYDREPKQIFVEVTLVRTQMTDLLEYGVNFANGLQVSNTLGSMVTRLPFNLGDHGFEDNLSVAGDGPSDVQIQDFLDGTTPAYTFGTLSFTGLTSVLRMLRNDNNTEIRQAPKLLAMDNEEATIFVGETVRWAQASVTVDQFGNPITTLSEAGQVATGFQLFLKANVVPGKDQVLMNIIPSFNSLTGTGEAIEGFDHFESGTATLDLPRVGSETVVTSMLLEDGQTGVMAGLMNTSEQHTVTKVPLLGDIPLVGRLFRSDLHNNTMRNLAIFVTVHIKRGPEDARNLIASQEDEQRNKFIQEQLDKLRGVKEGEPESKAPGDGRGFLTKEEIERELKRLSEGK